MANTLAAVGDTTVMANTHDHILFVTTACVATHNSASTFKTAPHLYNKDLGTHLLYSYELAGLEIVMITLS